MAGSAATSADGRSETPMFPAIAPLSRAQHRRLTFALLPPRMTLVFAPGAIAYTLAEGVGREAELCLQRPRHRRRLAGAAQHDRVAGLREADEDRQRRWLGDSGLRTCPWTWPCSETKRRACSRRASKAPWKRPWCSPMDGCWRLAFKSCRNAAECRRAQCSRTVPGGAPIWPHQRFVLDEQRWPARRW